MKSSALKWVILWILLLIIGAIWWYLFANYQHNSRMNRPEFLNKYPINSDYADFFGRSIHKDRHRDDIFRDLEKDFFDENEDAFYDEMLYKKDHFWKNNSAKWTFQYYEMVDKNGENTSYQVKWGWNEWDKTGSIIMSWINTKWKAFSFSWTIENWKSEWTLIDEDGHSKNINFENFDIEDIYKNSNQIEE